MGSLCFKQQVAKIVVLSSIEKIYKCFLKMNTMSDL